MNGILLLPAADRKIMIGKQHRFVFCAHYWWNVFRTNRKMEAKNSKSGIIPILLQRISLIPDGFNSAHLRGFQIKKKTVI